MDIVDDHEFATACTAFCPDDDVVTDREDVGMYRLYLRNTTWTRHYRSRPYTSTTFTATCPAQNVKRHVVDGHRLVY